jgi:hypothetical protein
MLLGLVGVQLRDAIRAGWTSWSGTASHGRDRNQRQSDVAKPLQEAMKGGLVGNWAADDSGAVALSREAEAVEPGGPTRVEMSLDSDLVFAHVGEVRDQGGDRGSPCVVIPVVIF